MFDGGVLKSLMSNSFKSLCCSVFASSFDALLLGAYTLRIAVSSWRICPFYHYVISQINFLAQKSALSETNIASLAFLKFLLPWYIFLHPFTFNLYVSSYLKYIFI